MFPNYHFDEVRPFAIKISRIFEGIIAVLIWNQFNNIDKIQNTSAVFRWRAILDPIVNEIFQFSGTSILEIIEGNKISYYLIIKKINLISQEDLFSLWRDKIAVEFSYYNQHVTDLLLFRSLAPSTGYLSRLENVGTLDNKGIEVMLRALPLQTRNVRWNTSVTFARNRNEVNGIEGDILLLADSFGQVAAVNGQPLGVFYTTFYARNADGSLLLTPTGLPQPEQRSRGTNGQPTGGTIRDVTGDPNPDFTASWINEVEIGRNFSVRAQLDAVQGFDVFNFTRRVGARGPLYGNLVDYQRELEGQVPAGYNTALFSILGAWVEDASFIKLRELSVSYDLHPKMLGLRSMRLSLIGRNLLSIDDYTGYDPEINTAGQSTGVRGFDFVEVPIPRSFSFGVTLNY